MPIPDHVRLPLRMTGPCNAEQVRVVHIYIDGSAHTSGVARPLAGWAFVVLFEVGDKLLGYSASCAGFLGDVDAAHIGADDPSNNAAEGVATLAASQWARHFGTLPKVRIEFQMDSVLARDVARGEASTTNRLALRACIQALACKATEASDPSWGHIEARCGHPWNDLADWLADAAVREACPADKFSTQGTRLLQFQVETDIGLHRGVQYPIVGLDGRVIMPIFVCKDTLTAITDTACSP
eukprot:15452686-Alexandrium_andersonii.AAC.2